MFMSANLVRIAKRRGIPVVFTIHDFWLMCPRQVRMKPDRSLCFEVKEDVCNACILAPPMTTSRLERAALHILQRFATYTTVKSVGALRSLKARMPDALMGKARGLHGGAGRSRANSGESATAAIQERNAYLADICSKVDMFIAPSRFIRDEFIRFGLSEEKITHSRNGHVSGWAKERGGRTGKLRFGYVGVVEEHKGVAVLIDAFNPIRKNDVELNIFGGHNVNLGYVKKIERSIANPAIRLRGRFDHDRIADIYAEIDVLVMPSFCFENAPLTICEAFAWRS
jgi:glycosyltransferase involved in cell wall biosynthesis